MYNTENAMGYSNMYSVMQVVHVCDFCMTGAAHTLKVTSNKVLHDCINWALARCNSLHSSNSLDHGQIFKPFD